MFLHRASQPGMPTTRRPLHAALFALHAAALLSPSATPPSPTITLPPPTATTPLPTATRPPRAALPAGVLFMSKRLREAATNSSRKGGPLLSFEVEPASFGALSLSAEGEHTDDDAPRLKIKRASDGTVEVSVRPASIRARDMGSLAWTWLREVQGGWDGGSRAATVQCVFVRPAFITACGASGGVTGWERGRTPATARCNWWGHVRGQCEGSTKHAFVGMK